MDEDSIYFRLGRRFQRIPADMRGWYLTFMDGELSVQLLKPNKVSPVGVVIDQIGTTLIVAEYETSGPMNFEEAMKPKELIFQYIKARCELPSRCELLQMYEQKDKFPEFNIGWLWSKEQYTTKTPWILYWNNGRMSGDYTICSNYVRRVFRISIKSSFV